jgi:hypothetical protein
MLRDLLHCIANNTGQSARELAECLASRGHHVDRGLVEIAILELEQKGFLRRESQETCAPTCSCSGDSATGACAHCPAQNAGRQAVTWVLTEKAGSVRRPV